MHGLTCAFVARIHKIGCVISYLVQEAGCALVGEEWRYANALSTYRNHILSFGAQ